MRLGRVTGRLWSSIKNPELDAQRLLVVQPVTPEGEDIGKPLVCTDVTGAGAGELIYWVRGREATFAFESGDVPSDATIVGIVDEVHLGKRKAG